MCYGVFRKKNRPYGQNNIPCTRVVCACMKNKNKKIKHATFAQTHDYRFDSGAINGTLLNRSSWTVSIIYSCVSLGLKTTLSYMVQSKLELRTRRRAIVELQNRYALVTRFKFRRKTQTLVFDNQSRGTPVFFNYRRYTAPYHSRFIVILC